MTLSQDLTLSTSVGDVPIRLQEEGAGRPVLLLHGGAGPVSVAGFARRLAEHAGVRVVAPTHPGWDGTPRPEGLTSVPALAELYDALLEQLGLEEVTVIGNSLGGWIAAELAVGRPATVARLVLVDAVGIEVPEHPIPDFFALAPAEVAARSWFDPTRAPLPDLAALSPAAREVFAGNRAALALYGGSMQDATLLSRLAAVNVPALVVWGEADRIVDVDYGRAYAAAISGARFEVLPTSGHLPQLETPDALLGVLGPFLSA